jgi:serine phosphatase RsbU (regulator of sigma subunit)
VKRSLIIGLSLLLAAALHAQEKTLVNDGPLGFTHELRKDTLVVTGIDKNLPADRAGVLPGDKVIEVDGHKISGVGLNYYDIDKYLNISAGDTVQLAIKRENTDSLITINLISDLSLVFSIPCNFIYLADSTGHLTIHDIVSDSVQSLFSSPLEKIMIIHSVKKDSPAEKAGLKAGDRIISLQKNLRYSYDGIELVHFVYDDSILVIKRDSMGITLPFNVRQTNGLKGVLSQYKYEISKKYLWFKIILTSKITEDRTYLLRGFNFDSVTIYEETGPGIFSVKKTGRLLANAEKDFVFKDWITAKIPVSKGKDKVLYIHTYNKNSNDYPPDIDLLAQDYLNEFTATERMIVGALYGMMFFMAFYYIILFLFIREKSYIWYSFFILGIVITLLYREGYAIEWLGSKTIHYNEITFSLLAALIFLMFDLFGIHYLDIQLTLKRWHKIIRINLYILGSCLILLVIGALTGVVDNIGNASPDTPFFYPITGIIFLSGLSVFFAATGLLIPTILRIRKGFKPAWYFLVAQAIFLLLIAFTFGVHPGSYQSDWKYITYHSSFAFTIVLQFFVFAAGLGHKMRTSEREKKKAQERIIEQLRENEKLKDKVNRELEQKVRERTKEIVQQKEEIEAQRDLLADQKQEITDSINYAHRIQTAVLPSKEMLDELLPEHFVLYKPRDIVSGDFYWIRQIKNFTIVVVADCTGHGVPGAFMSMLGISLLNDHVSKSRFDSAGEVLDRLRKKVKETLQQEGRAQEQKDGMDMALVIINNENLELQFAGAFNPLYIIRKKDPSGAGKWKDLLSMESNDFCLLEIKGDRQPIAIHTTEHNFTTNTFQLQKDDRLYLFSDGYCDQMGGPAGRKFMTHQFKELLLRVQDQPLDKQRILLDQTLENWMGSMQQIDDILVLGIRWK